MYLLETLANGRKNKNNGIPLNLTLYLCTGLSKIAVSLILAQIRIERNTPSIADEQWFSSSATDSSNDRSN